MRNFTLKFSMFLSGMPKEYTFWIVLYSVLLISSLFLSHYSLLGDFRTYQFGVEHQWMWDPDGVYLSSGILFFRGDGLDFPGHPGLFLQMLIGLISESMFALAKLQNCPVGFEKFIVKNYYWLVLIVRTLLTIIHLCSFFVLYKICLRLMSSRAALLAVFSYATTYTVIFYINRISPEAILMLSMLLSILFLFKYQEQTEEKKWTAAAYILLSSFFCSIACLSKFMLGVPFSIAMICSLFCLSFSKRRPDNLGKFYYFSLFCLFWGVFIYILSLKIDFSAFLEFWLKYSPMKMGNINQDFESASQIANVVNRYLHDYLYPFFSYKALLPQHSKMGLFVFSESLFAMLSIIGGFVLFKAAAIDSQKISLFIMVVVCTLPVVIYRNDFHYYFPYMVLGSIFLGAVISYWVDACLKAKISENKKFVAGLFIIGLIHYPGFMISLDGKLYNMKLYNRHKRYIDALKTIQYSEKLPVTIKKTALLRSLGFQYYTTSNSLKEAAAYYVNSSK